MQLPAIFDNLKVIVPAGGDAPPAAPPGTPEAPLTGKAFLQLKDRLVIEYVLDFLRDCGLRRIWVVAPADALARIPSRHAFTAVPQPPGASFFDNLLAGCAAAAPAAGEPVLIAFGDHPLNAPVALEFFLSRCLGLLDQADFFHALSLQDSYRDYASWFTRTSVHMREMSGRASGLSLAVPSRLHGISRLQALYAVRKIERPGSFLRLLAHLASWLGASAPRSILDAFLMYAAKEMEKASRGSWTGSEVCRRLESQIAARLPVGRMERCASRVLGAERGVRFIPVPHGGLAIDVDFAEELETLERHWDAIRDVSGRQDRALAGSMRTPATVEPRQSVGA